MVVLFCHLIHYYLSCGAVGWWAHLSLFSIYHSCYFHTVMLLFCSVLFPPPKRSVSSLWTCFSTAVYPRHLSLLPTLTWRGTLFYKPHVYCIISKPLQVGHGRICMFGTTSFNGGPQFRLCLIRERLLCYAIECMLWSQFVTLFPCESYLVAWMFEQHWFCFWFFLKRESLPSSFVFSEANIWKVCTKEILGGFSWLSKRFFGWFCIPQTELEIFKKELLKKREKLFRPACWKRRCYFDTDLYVINLMREKNDYCCTMTKRIVLTKHW